MCSFGVIPVQISRVALLVGACRGVVTNRLLRLDLAAIVPMNTQTVHGDTRPIGSDGRCVRLQNETSDLFARHAQQLTENVLQPVIIDART